MSLTSCMHLSGLSRSSLLVACDNGDLLGFAVNVDVPCKKAKLQFTLDNQPRIVSLACDAKQKYLFASFADGFLGIYENISHFQKKPYFIDKVAFNNPIGAILNTMDKDNLVIACKDTCVAFCAPHELKRQFILNVEEFKLAGMIFDAKKRILWTFGDDKHLRAWEIPQRLFGRDGEKRLLREWHKDKILDILNPKLVTSYVEDTREFDRLLDDEGTDSGSDIEEVRRQEQASSDEQANEEAPVAQEHKVLPKKPEKGYWEDVEDLVPKQTAEEEEEEAEAVEEADDWENNPNSAAKKYGLVKMPKIENLAVSNSENDSNDESQQQARTKARPKRTVKKPESKPKVVESDTESDDDLTGWF